PRALSRSGARVPAPRPHRAGGPLPAPARSRPRVGDLRRATGRAGDEHLSPRARSTRQRRAGEEGDLRAAPWRHPRVPPGRHPRPPLQGRAAHAVSLHVARLQEGGGDPLPGPAGDAVSSRSVILVTCCLSLFLVTMDLTVVNVALPAIRRDLHA